MRQTFALLTDAYRELNAKKLFWITMALSGLIVLVFAATGINERGLTFLHWQIPAPITTRMFSEAAFYKYAFFALGIGIWLTWVAMGLALISTASIIPDFVMSGSIELTLSKPIGRVRLFLTKYGCGLLFVGLQVLVFSVACFLVIGIRGGAWEPRVLLAVPLVLAVFSFIYCISALAGLLTRSTIAAVLVAALFWFFLFLLNSADQVTLMIKTQAESEVTRLEQQIARLEKTTREQMLKTRAAELEAAGKTGETPADPTAAEMDQANVLLATRRQRLPEREKTLRQATRWNNLFVYIKTPLPKTAETTSLLERYLMSEEDVRRMRQFQPGELDPDDPPSRADAAKTNGAKTGEGDGVKATVRVGPGGASAQSPEDQSDDGASGRETGFRVEDALRSRSIWWVLGTSLVFELVVLGIACAIFARRDF